MLVLVVVVLLLVVLLMVSVLNLVVVLLFQQHTGCMLTIPGKLVPSTITFLSKAIAEEEIYILIRYILMSGSLTPRVAGLTAHHAANSAGTAVRKASGTRLSNTATGPPSTPARPRPEFNSGCGRRCLCGKALRGGAGGHVAFDGDRELPVTQGRESASVASLLKRPRARRARFMARLRQWGC